MIHCNIKHFFLLLIILTGPSLFSMEYAYVWVAHKFGRATAEHSQLSFFQQLQQRSDKNLQQVSLSWQQHAQPSQSNPKK